MLLNSSFFPTASSPMLSLQHTYNNKQKSRIKVLLEPPKGIKFQTIDMFHQHIFAQSKVSQKMLMEMAEFKFYCAYQENRHIPLHMAKATGSVSSTPSPPVQRQLANNWLFTVLPPLLSLLCCSHSKQSPHHHLFTKLCPVQPRLFFPYWS